MPKDRRPQTRARTDSAAKGRAAKAPQPAPQPPPQTPTRENWVDKVDRVARRPFLEGDYMPGTIANRGDSSGECTPPKRRGRGR